MNFRMNFCMNFRMNFFGSFRLDETAEKNPYKNPYTNSYTAFAASEQLVTRAFFTHSPGRDGVAEGSGVGWKRGWDGEGGTKAVLAWERKARFNNEKLNSKQQSAQQHQSQFSHVS